MSRLVLANPKNGLVEWFDSILGGDSQVAEVVRHIRREFCGLTHKESCMVA